MFSVKTPRNLKSQNSFLRHEISKLCSYSHSRTSAPGTLSHFLIVCTTNSPHADSAPAPVAAHLNSSCLFSSSCPLTCLFLSSSPFSRLQRLQITRIKVEVKKKSMPRPGVSKMAGRS